MVGKEGEGELGVAGNTSGSPGLSGASDSHKDGWAWPTVLPFWTGQSEQAVLEKQAYAWLPAPKAPGSSEYQGWAERPGRAEGLAFAHPVPQDEQLTFWKLP